MVEARRKYSLATVKTATNFTAEMHEQVEPSTILSVRCRKSSHRHVATPSDCEGKPIWRSDTRVWYTRVWYRRLFKTQIQMSVDMWTVNLHKRAAASRVRVCTVVNFRVAPGKSGAHRERTFGNHRFSSLFTHPCSSTPNVCSLTFVFAAPPSLAGGRGAGGRGGSASGASPAGVHRDQGRCHCKGVEVVAQVFGEQAPQGNSRVQLG